jgi:hypothetical protein
MKVICAFIVFDVHQAAYILGTNFWIVATKKNQRKLEKFPKLLKAKNWKKTLDDNTIFGSQIKG